MSDALSNILDKIRLAGSDGALMREKGQLIVGDRVAFEIRGLEILSKESMSSSAEWEQRQAASVFRYEDTGYNAMLDLPYLFGSFLAAGHKEGELIVDVGCGISPDLPFYARDVPLEDYVGLEPLAKVVGREYVCLVGATCEAMPLADRSVDTLAFATSMDHIEDLEPARIEVQRVLKPGGRIVVWTGLYEPETIARSKTFGPIVYAGGTDRRIMRGVLIFFDYLYLLARISQRKRKIANDIPIDNVHFRYYTQESIEKQLIDWRFKITRKIVVPGTSSMFIEGRLMPDAYVG